MKCRWRRALERASERRRRLNERGSRGWRSSSRAPKLETASCSPVVLQTYVSTAATLRRASELPSRTRLERERRDLDEESDGRRREERARELAKSNSEEDKGEFPLLFFRDEAVERLQASNYQQSPAAFS